ncbi:competence protein ComK [Oceanobacillus senegalensis]|uniref:competence protein ComK n=1 Tax=Oceanobacillus senegalensis TaxID=1936063 RepID=UPI000A3129E8|nr:competence protein ComK [Oceanobacillus senegalensis]
MKHYYNVTKKTKLIRRNESAYYRSVIMEESVHEPKEIYSYQKPEDIINYNCKRFGSTLKGRIEVVKDVLNTTSKVPIPIIPHQGIYIVPTASIKNKDCVWIAYHHIKDYTQIHDKTQVRFYDGTSTVVNTTKAIMDGQYKRASQVIVHFNRNFLFGEGQNLW